MEKRELLLQRLRQKKENTSRTKITSQSRDSNIFPLSFAQQRLWFLEQLEPGNPFYNQPAAVGLTGALNLAVLKQSFNEIIRRHQVLRTTFSTVEGQPIQIIGSTLALKLPVVDLQKLPHAEREKEVRRIATEEAQKPFNLVEGPLLRCTLLLLEDTEQMLLFTTHHIISDGWSKGVLIREIATLYQAFSTGQLSPLAELPIQYADFAAWQRQWLQAEVLQSQISYWKKQLEGAPTVLELPTDHARPAVQTFLGATYSFELSVELSQALKKLSQQQGSTLFMTLLAAFQTLLWRYTGQEDIVVGSPIANRNRTEIEGLIGFFVNTLVLRTNLAGNPTFEELLAHVREVALGAYAHQDLPFEKLVEELQPQRSLSHTPLFQVMFVLQNAPMSALELPGLTLSPLTSESRTAKFDLTLLMTETAQGLVGNLEYNTNLFEDSTISRMAGHLQTLLSGIVANPQQHLSELPLLTEPERQTLLVEWNNTKVEYPQQQCIHQLFEAQVERTPDAVAVVFEDEPLTYCELNARANQLAYYLRSQGVEPEVLVGICVERSLDMLIGLLGILKAGGAYVPLDPTYPSERLAFILEDAQVPVLLTQARLVKAIPQHQAKVLCLDTDWLLIAQENKENFLTEVTTSNLAYVIYTSGSTGQPKGVQIPHRALNNFLHAMRQTPELTEQDTLLAVTTISFDIAALELFLPITVGARLVVVSREIASDGTRLSAKLTNSNATVMQATPATWQLLLTAGWEGNHQLKILCGGEALPGHLANQLLNRCDSLWNMYGPTETTIWSAACLVETVSSFVAISRPIANTQFYILDRHGQLVPIGVQGELHIGGTGLARGYLNRPELTTEKFIPNPFSDKLAARLYKTGDLARYLPNGDIEYLGRIDHQVKVRGFRIELAEIEAHLRQHLKVRETVVVLRSDEADSQRIVAYVVPQKEQTLTITELRDFLELKLPNYMVPAVFVILEALPLTPNGKVDRKALPVPDATQLLSHFTPPSTPIEQMLAGIWAEVLGLEKVGIYHNFFELGGHSLLATRVISLVRQVFQQELPLRRLFEQPIIAGLAKEIEKATKAGLGLETANIERISRSQKLPLSFAQQRLWFLAQLEPNSPFYNIPAAARLQGQLKLGALQQSFNEILRRHETLRTNFQITEGEPVAIISSVTLLLLSVVDISELSSNQQQAKVRQLANFEAQQPFDLNNDLLLRVKLLRLGEQEHIVLLTMHHIASDGWSIGVLVRELATLYQAFCTEQPSLRHATLTPLAELPIQYADFAAWQRQWLQAEVLQSQISYWKKQLEGAPTVLELPTDHARPAVQTFLGATYSFELSVELSQALKKLSQQQGSTLFMTLLAAFQTLLWRYTGQEDIVVGSPIANRNRTEIEGLIGFFVNTLVLRTNLAGNPTFEELLAHVREVALGAYAHQDLPFEKLVEELQPQRSLSHTPLFQVMFVLQNAPMSALELPGLTLSPLESESGSAKFDLTLSIKKTAQRLVGSLEYNTDLFEKSTISRMVEHLQTLLSGIVGNPQQCLSNLPVLTQTEKALLVQWNDTSVEYPQHQCIHELFEAQVERTPDAVAVVFEDQQLTYQELNARANQLAHHLRSLGVRPEVLVGICMERSLEMIVGLLGILKAGGAYMPLDPAYPQERLALILEDAKPLVLLTQKHLVVDLPKHGAKVVCMDADWEIDVFGCPQENPISSVTAENLAYVIYTSGSTGTPKGVLITHQALVNHSIAAAKAYQLQPEDRILQFASISFDVAAEELFPSWLSGSTVVIRPNRILAFANFLPFLEQEKLTVLNLPTAYWHDWVSDLAQTEAPLPSTLRLVIVGTEQTLPEKLALWEKLVGDLYHKLPGGHLRIRWLNAYGPTEATIGATIYEPPEPTTCQENQSIYRVPVGRPIANTQIYLLDKHLNPTPSGVPGELYISGVGIARGYLNRPELTAEKFIPNPFSEKSGTHLYKTGDLARYLPNGDIELLGRIDHQVKIRGFRIELGEIESKLKQHAKVREAVVVDRKDEEGDKRLVAYVSPHFEQTLTVTELRSFLQEKLPQYMVPSAFIVLPALPLLSNGKLDRHSLPAPETLRPEIEVAYVMPQTELEQKIAIVWQNALNIENIGIHDNFFELGGHSLLMVKVHTQLREISKTDLLLLDLFRYPTISSLAEFFSQAHNQTLPLSETNIQTEKISAGKSQQKRRREKMKSIMNIKGVQE
ncbi:amino acid adenylation domain-containing protein [Nostoc sp.]|uniref:amino acid adenylation domain-containing protein n=1 Tax=Nostoc sp. TaxID=1180 RepID=UPI003FA5D9ED